MLKADVLEGLANHQADGSEVAENGGLVQVAVTLTGTSPLLMNAISEDQLLKIRDKTKPSKSAARPKPREEAASKVYLLPGGIPHIPTKNLYSCFIAAGVFVRLDGKRQVSTEKKTMLPGMLGIIDTNLPVYTPGKDEKAAWEVDIQKGTNPNGSEAVCVIRPRFDAWELRLVVEVDQEQMGLAMARDLISIAGRRIGLGDFRPSKKGTFGRFSINLWKPMEVRAAA